MTRNEKRRLEQKAQRMAKHLAAVVSEAERYQADYQAASPEVQAFLQRFLDLPKFMAYKAAAETFRTAMKDALATYMEADET